MTAPTSVPTRTPSHTAETTRRIGAFPTNPVVRAPSRRGLPRLPAPPAVLDEITVRLVAAAILVIAVVALATQQWWLYAVLAVDFLIRASLGPRFSPVAEPVRRVVRPRIARPPVPTAAAPKRFAAGIGAVLTGVAAVLLALASPAGPAAATAVWLIGLAMVVFPALEAFLGLCIGCHLFRLLIHIGLARETVCVDCVPRGPKEPLS